VLYDAKYIYLVLDFKKWGNLEVHLERHGRCNFLDDTLEEETIQYVVAATLKTLLFSHEKGIPYAHRDIKLNNIMIENIF